MAALDVIAEENLAENATIKGEHLRKELRSANLPHINLVRGRGLLNAIVINESETVNAYDICLKLRDNGLLAKPTHGNIIRLAPPLIINDSQMSQCLDIMVNTIKEF